jgi:hypothetical protein
MDSKQSNTTTSSDNHPDITKAESQSVSTATKTYAPLSLQEVVTDIQSVCLLPEDLIKVVMATYISVKLDIPSSLWLMVIGVPSSAKTDLVNMLRKANNSYFVDTLTQNPFASGYVPKKGQKAYDLLNEVPGKCLIIKDFTTIFSLNHDTVKKLLGELVSIYDGYYKKFSPTRGLKEYETVFSHIGCITPSAINKHYNYMNIIGPRFFFYRLPQIDPKKINQGFDIAWQSNRKKKLEEISNKVCTYLEQIEKPLDETPPQIHFSTPGIKKAIEQLAYFTSKSRGTVFSQQQDFKDSQGNQISYFDVRDCQIEEPWRAFNQLKGLATSLAVINQSDKVTWEEIRILEKIVLSSMPTLRAEVIEVFRKTKQLTSKELSQAIQKSQRTCQRVLKELEYLEILNSTQPHGPKAKVYSLKTEFCQFVQQATPKSLSHYLPDKTSSDIAPKQIDLERNHE